MRSKNNLLSPVVQAGVNGFDRLITTAALFSTNFMLAHLDEGGSPLSALPYISSLQTLTTISVTAALSLIGGKLASTYRLDNHGGEDLKSIVREGQLLGLLESIPMVGIMYLSQFIIQPLGVSHEVAGIVFKYFLFQAPVLMFLAMRMPAQQLFIGTEYKKYALSLNLLLSTLQIGLAYALTFGEYGFPSWGILGPGFAALVKSMSHFLCHEAYLAHLGFSSSLSLCFGKTQIGELWTKGWPTGLQYTLELSAVFITSIMTGYLKGNALKIRGITSQATLFIVPLVFALSQSATYSVGRIRGMIAAKRPGFSYEDIRKTGYKSMLCGLATTAAFLVVMLANTDWYIKIFGGFRQQFTNSDRKEMRTLLILGVASQIPDSIRNISSGILKSSGNTRFSSAESVFFRLIFRTGLSLLLRFSCDLGLEGFAWANLTSLTLSAAVMFAYMLYSTEQHHWSILGNKQKVSYLREVSSEFAGFWGYLRKQNQQDNGATVSERTLLQISA